MHPYLTRLGVRPEVQEHFTPYWLADSADLFFQQDDYREHFGLAFHRVQAGNSLWIGGEPNLAFVSRAFVSNSVMDLIAWLHFYGHTIPRWDEAAFIAVGLNPSKAQIDFIADRLKRKALTLVYPADLLGAIADLKIAAAVRQVPAEAFLAEKERLHICFRCKVFEFEQQKFSLSAFEKVSKYRFNVTTRKPKQGASFLDQLKAGAFPSP